jgi:hypothetical protein
MVDDVARMGKNKNVYRVLVKKPNVKKPFGRRGSLPEDNINIDAKETI